MRFWGKIDPFPLSHFVTNLGTPSRMTSTSHAYKVNIHKVMIIVYNRTILVVQKLSSIVKLNQCAL